MDFRSSPRSRYVRIPTEFHHFVCSLATQRSPLSSSSYNARPISIPHFHDHIFCDTSLQQPNRTVRLICLYDGPIQCTNAVKFLVLFLTFIYADRFLLSTFVIYTPNPFCSCPSAVITCALSFNLISFTASRPHHLPLNRQIFHVFFLLMCICRPIGVRLAHALRP